MSLNFFKENNLIPREAQIKVLKFLDENDNNKHFIIDAPTGCGKSHIAISKGFNKRSFILTNTKQLQDSYLSLFKDNTDIVLLKGKSNYPCYFNAKLTCENGICSTFKSIKRRCMKNGLCPYYQKLKEAMLAPVIVTNYDYFMYAVYCGAFSENSKYPREAIERDFLFCDEAHSLESKLVGFAEFTVDLEELDKKHGIKSDKWIFTNNLDDNVNLLADIYIQVESKCAAYQAKMENIHNKYEYQAEDIISGHINNISMNAKDESISNDLYRKHKLLDQVLQKFIIYYKNIENNRWIYDTKSKTEFMLSPLKASGLFNEYFKDVTNQYIFMSATIGEVSAFIKELDLDEDSTESISVSSDFDPENSPILYLPSGKMNYQNIDNSLPQITKVIERILAENHPEDKGIIHTSSYKIADYVYNNMEDISRILHRDMDGTKWKLNNYQLIERHKKSPDIPTVLLSPSMIEGVSLDGDLSRFQIIVKLPFLSLANFRTKVKMNLDSGWYSSKMWIALMQASGRSTRSVDDYSITYILDSSFEYFFKASKDKLSGWFVERVEL